MPRSWHIVALSWALLGRSWSDPGRFWAILGPSWGHLGPSQGALGRSRGALGRSWGDLGAILGHLGAILGPSWAISSHLATILRHPTPCVRKCTKDNDFPGFSPLRLTSAVVDPFGPRTGFSSKPAFPQFASSPKKLQAAELRSLPLPVNPFPTVRKLTEETLNWPLATLPTPLPVT